MIYFFFLIFLLFITNCMLNYWVILVFLNCVLTNIWFVYKYGKINFLGLKSSKCVLLASSRRHTAGRIGPNIRRTLCAIQHIGSPTMQAIHIFLRIIKIETKINGNPSNLHSKIKQTNFNLIIFCISYISAVHN